jgi:hypothetical protein
MSMNFGNQRPHFPPNSYHTLYQIEVTLEAAKVTPDLKFAFGQTIGIRENIVQTVSPSHSRRLVVEVPIDE